MSLEDTTTQSLYQEDIKVKIILKLNKANKNDHND